MNVEKDSTENIASRREMCATDLEINVGMERLNCVLSGDVIRAGHTPVRRTFTETDRGPRKHFHSAFHLPSRLSIHLSIYINLNIYETKSITSQCSSNNTN